jgi:hypothetical protein
LALEESAAVFILAKPLIRIFIQNPSIIEDGAVFLIAAALAGYKGFIAVHLFADFLSGLIALILFRTINLGRKMAE